MDLYELAGVQKENHPSYQALQSTNLKRQYDYLSSIIRAAIEMKRTVISHSIVKSLNYHAIVGLHSAAGVYRPCEVNVGKFKPPQFYRVEPLMDDFINAVNLKWESMSPTSLASLALWRINAVHPFINGNGRTARAVCYFILCVRIGNELPGSMTVPELMTKTPYRGIYDQALKEADKLNHTPLTALVAHLADVQVGSAKPIAAQFQ